MVNRPSGVPLGDFFSNVNGIDPYRMWEREVRSDGTMVCRWIMPYQERGTLRLHNLAARPGDGGPSRRRLAVGMDERIHCIFTPPGGRMSHSRRGRCGT